MIGDLARTRIGSETAAGPALRVGDIHPVLPARPDASVIFRDDFDQRPDAGSRYFEYGAENGSFVWDGAQGLGESGGAMRAHFERGQVSAGSLKVVFGRNPFRRGYRPNETFREIWWRVYVMHEPGWQGNPAKLARATVMAGPDWSQGLIAHVWGGKGDALCIDPATGITNGRKVTTRYNDFAHLRWLGVQHGRTTIFSPAESGRWVCVESHIRINTPGKRDGVFELWVDAKPEAGRTDLDWHGEWNEYAINAVFLENYWNQGSVRPQSRWFDSFVISTRPIGPLRTSGKPVLHMTRPTPGAQAQAASDPNGADIVWTSRPAGAQGRAVTVDATSGSFSGSHARRSSLLPDKTYWVRARERRASAWSPWHMPFRTSGDAA